MKRCFAKGLVLGFYAALMLLQCCPTWFVAFLLTTYLLQVAAYLALAHAPEHRKLSFAERVNVAAQLVWVLVVLLDFSLRSSFPRVFIYSAAFHLTGYAVLTATQGIAFFHFFTRFRPTLLPDPRAIAT